MNLREIAETAWKFRSEKWDEVPYVHGFECGAEWILGILEEHGETGAVKIVENLLKK